MGDYVLVVDDSPDIRNMVVKMLDGMKVETRQAVNGQQALEIIDEEAPHLIVLDLMMPVMSGFAMLTQLNGRKMAPIPVILLSGVADDQQMRSLPGVVGALKKGSFTAEELQTLLAHGLKDLLDARAAEQMKAAKADTRPLPERPIPGISTRLV